MCNKVFLVNICKAPLQQKHGNSMMCYRTVRVLRPGIPNSGRGKKFEGVRQLDGEQGRNNDVASTWTHWLLISV